MLVYYYAVLWLSYYISILYHYTIVILFHYIIVLLYYITNRNFRLINPSQENPPLAGTVLEFKKDLYGPILNMKGRSP